MPNVMIGCDPEGFLRLKGGKFVSAAGLFPGTKDEPYKLDGGAVQVDGVALEFNIDAAETKEAFVGNIKKVLDQIDGLVSKVDKDLQFSFVPVADFDKKTWEKVPDDAKVLGCDPDFSALTGMVNVNPTDSLKDSAIRTAAGHIHIGWTSGQDPDNFKHFVDCRYIAQKFHNGGLEYFRPRTDEEYRRLQFYGHSGSFRAKPYGVELRAPSNRWVANEESRGLMYDIVRNAFKKFTGM